MNAGPGGKTMPEADIEKVIDNLPRNLTSITLTGGEPFTARKSLMHALSYIHENRERILGKRTLNVQTNGFLVTNPEQTYQTLKELEELGLDELVFTSFNRYHSEQGLDIGKLNLRDKSSILSKARELLYSRVSNKMKINVGHSKNTAIPIGRAKQLPENEKRAHSECDIPSQYFADNPKMITIDNEGKLYACKWQVTPAIGSAIESPVEKLVEQAYSNPLMKALFTGGLRGAAKYLGVYNPAEESRYAGNPCAKCEEVFSAFKEAKK